MKVKNIGNKSYFPLPLNWVFQLAGAVEYTDCFSAEG